MKKSMKAISVALTFALSLSAMPTISSFAYQYQYNPYAVQDEVQINFVIFSYRENEDGELTITSCFDYDENFKVNPRLGGYVAGSAVNGVLKVPSHIDGKPVVAIKSLFGTACFRKLIIPDSITDISDRAYSKYVSVETTEKESNLVTIYVHISND